MTLELEVRGFLVRAVLDIVEHVEPDKSCHARLIEALMHDEPTRNVCKTFLCGQGLDVNQLLHNAIRLRNT